MAGVAEGRPIAFGFLIAGRSSFERARLHRLRKNSEDMGHPDAIHFSCFEKSSFSAASSAVPKLGAKNGPA
jgi:hypothetical protein